MSLPSGQTVCIYRPNRSKKRVYTVCDLARIAQSLVDNQDETPEAVLAYVARQLGFSHISLSRVQTVEAAISLKKSVSLIKVVVGQLAILTKRLGLPFITSLIATILELLDDLDRLIDRFFGSKPAQEETDNFIDEGKCKNLKASTNTTK